MLPFLASSVVVHKADGSTVTVNSDGSPAPADEDRSESSAGTSTAPGHSKHHSSSSDTGIEVVPIVAIVFVFLWLIVKALMAPFTQRAARRNDVPSNGAQVLSEDEQAVLVKLQRTIVQMERRIESLETILIDEHRTKEKYGNKI